MVSSVARALITLGSNASEDLVENKEHLEVAMGHIEAIFGNNTKKSKLYQTPAFPKGAGPDFVNAAISVETDQTAKKILDHLLRIEQEMGRIRTTRWAQRKIDLDLIAVGSLLLPDLETYTYWYALTLENQKREAPEQLILPHPRLQDRAFVLGPLMDIAPEWVHPYLNKSVEELWMELTDDDRREICAL